MTQLAILNPTEFGLTEEKANEITRDLPQILTEREPLIAQYNEVIVMDIEDPKTAERASEVRKLIKNNRTKGLEAWHKNNKEYFLRGGQFVDAIKKREVAENERMEDALEQIEKYAENKEKERMAALQTERVELIRPYVESPELLKLGEMNQDVWDAYFSAKKSAHEKKVEEEKQAEAARIEKERAEQEERDRIKKEHEEQQKIIAEQNRIIEEERLKAEKEKKAIEDQAAKERQEAAQKLEKEQDDLRKARQEIKDKEEAEAKAIADQKAKQEEEDRAAKSAAAKAAKAPKKQKLNLWIDSFLLSDPLSLTGDETVLEITEKFNSFKQWAKSKVEEL